MFVFNLEVEWPHCFYAEGVLVHNCDSTSQALLWVRKHGVVLRKVEFDTQETEKKRFRRTLAVPYAP